MKCPLDQAELTMSERQGIEIDYCPRCRGVWLDRGELDKILERSSAPASQTQAQSASYTESREYDRPRDGHSDGYQHGYKKRKKENFLGELFDF